MAKKGVYKISGEAYPQVGKPYTYNGTQRPQKQKKTSKK
jgi:hypothetical protein